ncbi:GNAT family N-acetyltransferase [Micromonospora pattaloongensis]|uniref:GNAT family N-acetyltransferase n=1 Tax=Micromonospora pattaloongensis TaxID=405436 RepID=UPI00158746FE|nr:GNAT family N-acetyltransferase [Micromonospora pattaloongensis]
MTPRWRPLADDDLGAVASLALRCLAVDGGLPLAATEPFLGRRYSGDGVLGRGVRDAGGELIAVAALRAQRADGVRAAVLTGLVDPAHRGRGLGSALLNWGTAAAPAVGERLTVETETLTPAGQEFLRRQGLRRVFAEDVLRFDLAGTPLPSHPLPDGIALVPWRPETAERFFAVYRAAFRERPGFPGWSARRWIDWTSGDDGFRPQWSLLATDPVVRDVGFVTCADGWIVQLGTVPGARGRGLGAALAAAALARMRAAGLTAALLDVNVDNPAGRLYERLGFTVIGRRARFATG